MRHGDRFDNFEPSWASTTSRPWDPPLAEAGRVRAFQTARRLRHSLGYRIHRVFASPFLRCVQTATEVVSALAAVNDGPDAVTCDGVVVDPSYVKVSIETGLCEMMNNQAIRTDVAPKDGIFSFDISELEAMLPAGTVDTDVERLYKEVYRGLIFIFNCDLFSNHMGINFCGLMKTFVRKLQLPQWKEAGFQARTRYEQVFKDLANKYPTQNLLLVTHGINNHSFVYTIGRHICVFSDKSSSKMREGVGVAVSSFKKNTAVYEVQYCAYVELRRPILKKDQSFTTGEFNVLIHSGQTGVSYFLPSALSNDINQTTQ